MELHYSLDRDLSEARTLADGLEDYVLNGQLYGTVGDGMYGADSGMPSLTIGALLLRLRRLQKLESQMTSEQKAILTAVEMENDRVRTDWREHYQGKLHNEAGARLHALESFLAECDGNAEACGDDYPPEMLRRTILQEIVATLHKYNMAAIDLDSSLQRRDSQLKRLTEPADFMWDETLKIVYPQDSYWWLYARPRVEEPEAADTQQRSK
jgi:hypothetical protein